MVGIWQRWNICDEKMYRKKIFGRINWLTSYFLIYLLTSNCIGALSIDLEIFQSCSFAGQGIRTALCQSRCITTYGGFLLLL